MDSPETAITLTDQPKHVVLTLEVPSSSNAADTLPLVQAVFGFVDYIESKQFSLRPETRPKLKKVRAEMEEYLKREVKKDDARTRILPPAGVDTDPAFRKTPARRSAQRSGNSSRSVSPNSAPQSRRRLAASLPFATMI